MTIEKIPGGGHVITRKQDIELMRLITLKAALRMHIKGIRMSKVSPVKVARQMGFAGRTAKQLLPRVVEEIERRMANRNKENA